MYNPAVKVLIVGAIAVGATAKTIPLAVLAILNEVPVSPTAVTIPSDNTIYVNSPLSSHPTSSRRSLEASLIGTALIKPMVTEIYKAASISFEKVPGTPAACGIAIGYGTAPNSSSISCFNFKYMGSSDYPTNFDEEDPNTTFSIDSNYVGGKEDDLEWEYFSRRLLTGYADPSHFKYTH